MTHASIFNTLALVTGLLITSVAFAKKENSFQTPFTGNENNVINTQTGIESNGKALPTPAEEPEKKMREPKTEELAHIHHFHKERVRKLKRHHNKFWILSKILLVICHLLILALAFIHLTN